MQTLTREPQANLMLARYYSPAGTMRFASVDPGDDTDLEAPQSWNKYAYVRKAYKDLGKEAGVPVRGPESHPGRPMGQQEHIHVGPVNHIPVKPDPKAP